jgi:predicted DNA-binding transcriptional regulator AlpA
MSTENTWGTAKKVREHFGDISDMTLWRWQNDPKLAFPKPIYIRGRRFWRWSDLTAWEAVREDGAAKGRAA